MEGGRKKRKVENEEDEEEKMQKFFALLRSTRDMRERMINRVDKLQEEEKKKSGQQEKPAEVGNLTFRPEDFMVDANGKPEGTAQKSLAGPSNREDETKEEEDKVEGGDSDGLDLNLSL